jgi:Uma2 family endonuclease
MSTLKKNVMLSMDEYLEGEKYSMVKHEYEAGHIYCMLGASRTHNLISLNLVYALRTHLRGTPCRVYMANMKVHVADAFYYPDVVVACDPTDRHEYYLERPALIIEVLSSSTELRDGVEKRLAYQSIASLQEYALVAQDKMEVRVYRRSDDGWDVESYFEGDVLQLTVLDFELPIEQIYEEVW